MFDTVRHKLFEYFENDGKKCYSCPHMYVEHENNWGTCLLADKGDNEMLCLAIKDIYPNWDKHAFLLDAEDLLDYSPIIRNYAVDNQVIVETMQDYHFMLHWKGPSVIDIMNAEAWGGTRSLSTEVLARVECSACKRTIRMKLFNTSDKENQERLQYYGEMVTHGTCPECFHKLYGDLL